MTDINEIFGEVLGGKFKHYFNNEKTDGSLNTVGYAEIQNLRKNQESSPSIPEGLEGYLVDSDSEEGQMLENWLVWDPKKWSLVVYESPEVVPKEMMEGYHKVRETEDGKTIGLIMNSLVV